ncbi:MAG: hypothetical protein HQM01_11840 [Magnetococcales bacterium]|nr:hypothetical protein [Magnetococcales bacterium]
MPFPFVPRKVRSEYPALHVTRGVNAGGLVLEIQLEGVQPFGEGLIRAIAKEARRIVAARTLREAEARGEAAMPLARLREILKGIEILPVHATRIFLVYDDTARLINHFGTDFFPKFNFLRLDPHETDQLSKIRLYGDVCHDIRFVEEEDETHAEPDEDDILEDWRNPGGGLISGRGSS